MSSEGLRGAKVLCDATGWHATRFKRIDGSLYRRLRPMAPRVLSKERFLTYDRMGRPAVAAFVTYVDSGKPVILHRFGRQDYSDAYDDFMDQFSYDNGRTWTEPVLHLKGRDVKGGRLRYGRPPCTTPTPARSW